VRPDAGRTALRAPGASRGLLRGIEDQGQLGRTLGLKGAVAVNMLDMIGVGPFITLPLLLSAMGGPQAMLGWVLGALLAVCDGLVWAELGATMPEAGGSYRFLREMFPGRTGRFLAFLFVFQLMFSAPLSVASGCIGLSQYAAYLWPVLHGAAWHWGRIIAGAGTAVAIAAVGLAILLLYRNLASLRIVSYVLWTTVMGTLAWIFATALMHGHLAQAFDFPSGAFRLSPAFFAGLASAMLVATYDFWGYYNVAFLGGEVKDAGKVIPRAILISIGAVGLIYLALNVAVLAVVPWRPLVAMKDLGERQALISFFMQTAYGGTGGALAGKIAAVLVGYSRIPFAAARDANFFAALGRLHRRGFPHVSLLWLGGAAALFCFFSLGEVIAGLVVLRILVQFLAQHAGVMWMRRTQPERRRPFRMWLYPVPPVVALVGFGWILMGRANYLRELGMAFCVLVVGAGVYVVRSRQMHLRSR
jgi:amino acid transporter